MSFNPREYNPHLLEKPNNLQIIFDCSNELNYSFWDSVNYWVRYFKNASLEPSSIAQLSNKIIYMIENYNFEYKPQFRIYFTTLINDIGKLELLFYRSNNADN